MELAMRGEKSVPRLAFLEGALELMSPSRDHERITSYLGRLIEVYAEQRGHRAVAGIAAGRSRVGAPPVASPMSATSWAPTIEGPSRPRHRGDLDQRGLDKLAIYQRLGTTRSWFWIAGRLEGHSLRGGTYERVARSRWLPGLDLDLMCAFSIAARCTWPSAISARRCVTAK